MPYFTLVGNVASNKTGVGARGYHVYRRGTRVRVVWGPINTFRSRTVRLEWSRTTIYKDYHCRTLRAAVRKLRELIQARELEGYKRLPTGARLVRLAVASRSTRRP